MWVRYDLPNKKYLYSLDQGQNWNDLTFDASVITQGTLNIARIPAIPYSKLSLADNDIPWAKVSKSGSILTDIATLRIGNNSPLYWRNAANDNDVAAIKLNGSDVIELGAISNVNVDTGFAIGSLGNRRRISYAPATSKFGFLNDANGWANVAANLFYERNRSVSIGEWQTYSPTWGSSGGTQPSIGNGTLTARYTLIGATVIVQIYLLIGSTTTFGTGYWYWTPPVTILSTAYFGGSVFISDWNTGYHTGTPFFASSTIFTFVSKTGAAGSFGGLPASDCPHNWSTNDQLMLQFIYEMA